MTRRSALRSLLRHPISQNAAALYLVQFAISVLPLVTLPYLARVLGPHALGLVVFSQSFTWMLQLVIEFGFGFSGTRAVARRRDDAEDLARAVASVQGAKLCLSTGSVAVAAVALFAVPIFRDHPGYLGMALVTAIAQGLEPTWYFTGVERLRLVSAIGVANRVAATVLTIVLVGGRGDGWIVLALWAAGAVIVTATTTVLMYRQVRRRMPARGDVRWALGEGWRLFVGGTAATLYTTANVFLLGVLSSATQAAFFSTAEKLVRAAPRTFSPIITAVYPRIGNLVARGEEERAARLTRLTLPLLAAVSTGISLVLFLGAEPIVTILYGDGFKASIEVLRILALILPMAAISGGLSNLQLLTHQRDRDVVLIILASGLLNLGLALVLAPTHGALGMAWGLVAVEGVALAGTLLAVMLPRRGGARAVGGRPA